MDLTDIADAITLFQYSNTGRSQGRAQVLIARLQGLYRTKAIHILNIGKPTLHGDWDGHKIRVNNAHLNSLQAGLRLGALSLVLVHEGTHAIVHMPDIYDELAARLASDPLLPRIDRSRRVQRGKRSAASRRAHPDRQDPGAQYAVGGKAKHGACPRPVDRLSVFARRLR